MKDMNKTKRQLMDELVGLRERVAALETVEAERKQEIERLQFISEAAEQSSEGLAVSNLDGELQFVNKAFAKMHGYDPEDLVGEHLSIFHTPEQVPSVDAANRELRETGRFSGEVWHIRRDGTVFPTLMQNSLLKDRAGTAIGMIGTVNDITELKQTEEALRESEQRVRSFTESAPDYIVQVDREGKILFTNRTYRGVSMDEVVGSSLFDWLPEQYIPIAESALTQAIDAGAPKVFEYWAADAEGNQRRYSAHVGPIAEDVQAETAILVIREITERKRAEAELAESERNYRNLVDNALVGIFKSNMEGEILYVNDALVSMLEYDSPEELQTISVLDTYEDPEARDALIGALNEEGKVAGHEIRLLTKTGSTKNVLVSEVLEHGILSGMMIDITEHRAMDQELRQNEERHRALFEGSLDAIILADPLSGSIIDANPAASELFLMENREMVGLHQSELYPSRLREHATDVFATIVNERDQDQPAEITVLRSNGTERPVEMLAHIIQIDGRLVVYQVFRDISERKMTAEALRRAAERYRKLFDDSPISLWEEDYSEVRKYIEQLRQEGVTDFRGYFEGDPEAVEQCASMVKVVHVNEATLEMYEAESKEDFIEGLGRLFTEQSYEVFREGLIAIAEGKTFFEGEAANRTLRGRRKDIQIRWSIPKDYEKTLDSVLVSIIDVTERKRMEQELGNIQRLQSLGVLAGGIAHDFNNILTAIMTNLSMARFYGALDDEVSQMLADAEKASLRAKGLTEQLLTFSKGGDPIKKTMRVSTFLKESVLFALSGSNARCEFSMPEEPWMIDADEGQISQVFQNLVINADQAMPEGGVIRIHVENVHIREEESGRLKSGPYVKVSVTDQGNGMPEEQLSKIFDPFFTTKERGRGLGLTIAFSVVHRHGGHIEVVSELGEGTVFHVYLPTTERPAEPKGIATQELVRGEGRVLVIDDEEVVRRSAGEVLKRLGYEVGFAKDGTEGILLYEEAMEGQHPFDVVIMDLTIPGELGGKKAVAKLRDLHPDAKVIVSSGYSDDPVMSKFREYGFDGILVKPYRVEDLATAIHRVLVPGPRDEAKNEIT